MAKAVKAVGTALVIVGAVALTGGAALMGGFAGATTLFGVSAQTLIGVGSLVSSVGGALSKPKVGSGGSPVTWTADPNAPLHFAAGRIGVAGQIVYRAAYGPNDRMYQSLISVVSAAGPIDGWESFKADDTSVTFDASGKANSSYYANVMWRQTRLGSQPDTALTSPSGLEGGASLPNWNSSYRLSGKASYILTLSENSKRSAYSGREPAPLNVVRGLKVYDPRLDSTYPGGSGSHRLSNPATWTYSQNPILWGLKWALGLWEGPTGKGAPQVDQQVGGIGSHIDAIDVASFVEAANIADANGWTPGALASIVDGNRSWAPLTPANLSAIDGAIVRATGINSTAISHVLRSSDFGFTAEDVPADATITGVEIELVRRRSFGSGVPFARHARLSINSTGTLSDQIGQNNNTDVEWTNSFTTAPYGGASDLWGAELTPALIQDPMFGFDYGLQGGAASMDAAIDQLRMRVHFTTPGSPTPTRRAPRFFHWL